MRGLSTYTVPLSSSGLPSASSPTGMMRVTTLPASVVMGRAEQVLGVADGDARLAREVGEEPDVEIVADEPRLRLRGHAIVPGRAGIRPARGGCNRRWTSFLRRTVDVEGRGR